MNTEKIALIIPTIGRLDYIKKLFDSISAQSLLPEELIIVNAGSSDISGVMQNYKNLNIKYVTSEIASLTRQRNVGISSISPGITLAGFVDDDIILHKGSLENMLKFWKTACPETGGASFNNVSDSFKKANIVEKIFCLNASKRGKVLRSGFNSKICSVEEDMRADWLFGGITVWRRKVLEEFKFDEWFKGNAYCDDLDYSYRAGRKYKLMVVKEAKVLHEGAPVSFNKEYFFGKTITRNRVYFVKKHKYFSILLCYWASTGLLLKNLFYGILTLRIGHILRSIGICAGIITSLGSRRC